MAARGSKCECGGKYIRRLYRHVQNVGAATVTDGSAFARQCEECGQALLSMRQIANYERRAAAVALRDGTKVSGAMVKFARKALGMTQEELGAALACRGETVSRWEHDHEATTRTSQLAIVALLEHNGPEAEVLVTTRRARTA